MNDEPLPAVGRPLGYRRDLYLMAALCVLVALTWLPRMSGPIDLRWDAGVYYVLGTSIAEGSGYRLLNEPGAVTGVQYPPLFPAIIALHQRAAGAADPTIVGRHLRTTFFVMSLALAVLCFVFLRRYMSPPWALAGGALVVLHTTTVFVSDISFAELPYVLATLLFFAIARSSPGPRREIAGALLASAAFLLRTAGIALLAAWVLDALLGRRFRAAAARALLVLPAFAGWQLHVWRTERSTEYTQPAYEYQRASYLFYNVSYAKNIRLRDPNRPELGEVSPGLLASRIARNLAGAPVRLGETVTMTRESWRRHLGRVRLFGESARRVTNPLLSIGLSALGILALAGLAVAFARGDRVVPLYTGLSVLAIAATPWPHMERYWFPIAPMLVAGLAIAVRHGWSFLQTKVEARPPMAIRSLSVAVVLLLAAQGLALRDFFRWRHNPVSYVDRRGEAINYRLFYYRDTYAALDAAIDSLRKDARPGDIVAASMPHWVHLRTGLATVKPPFEVEPGVAARLIDAIPVAYVLVDGRSGSFTRVFALPAIAGQPDRWEVAFSDEDREVATYRRIRDD